MPTQPHTTPNPPLDYKPAPPGEKNFPHFEEAALYSIAVGAITHRQYEAPSFTIGALPYTAVAMIFSIVELLSEQSEQSIILMSDLRRSIEMFTAICYRV